MATIVIPTSRDLIRSLQSDLCPICGGWKRSAQTMCPKDYGRLGSVAKRNLYSRIGEGYEEAIRDAMVALGKETFILPPAK